MGICGRHSSGSPTILLGFIDFQKVKLLKGKPPLGTVLFSTFASIRWKRPQEEVVCTLVPTSSSDSCGTGSAVSTQESCGRRKGGDVCKSMAVSQCQPPQARVVATGWWRQAGSGNASHINIHRNFL